MMRIFKIWSKLVKATNIMKLFQNKLKNLKSDLKGWGANLRGTDIKIKKDFLRNYKI
jgi:hypothetical protein